MLTNNDILRRLRYTFDFSDSEMIAIFDLAETTVTRAEISDWLKKDEDPECKKMSDRELSIFLNGFINLKRGKKEGEQPIPEIKLNNNLIFRKLRIALSLTDESIVEIIGLGDFKVGKPEINSFFRNPNQPQYRPCKDQILRYFLKGLQKKFRDGNAENE